VEVRRPAVAGAFYPADRDELLRQVRACLGRPASARRAVGAVVPHAGYAYSGGVAGAVFSRIEIPSRVVILCPNHTGMGAAAAFDPHDVWLTPLGPASVDADLRTLLMSHCPSASLDAAAHRREHSLEVQLPFLQVLRPDFSFVPICIGGVSLPLCREIGEACAAAALASREPLLILASSDMNHYESREIGNAKNSRALARIESLDPRGLFETVLANDISMCGFLPATSLLFAAARLEARRAEVVALADSGDQTGDTSSVVGYAGVIVE
jgi:MEMO1 family protein